MIQLQEDYKRVELEVSLAVSEIAARRGVPTSLRAVDQIGDELFPLILDSRRAIGSRERAAILAEYPVLTWLRSGGMESTERARLSAIQPG